MAEASPDRLSRLEQAIAEIGALHSRLILLVGPPRSGKTALLRSLGKRMGVVPLNVGSALGKRLALIPHRQRRLQTGNLLRELADRDAQGDLLLLDNLELLFDATLQLNPLDLLKRHAHARKVVAVWPGILKKGRLIYADLGHPEYRDYAVDRVVPLEIQP